MGRHTESIGVAISTTGQEHRLGFLETCVRAWRNNLPLGSVLVVTVDGDEDEQREAYKVAQPVTHSDGGLVIAVGRRLGEPRAGVAATKNTGIEYLMDSGVRHLYLCDDDTWPRHPQALIKHENGEPHSMVGWGQSRVKKKYPDKVVWTWPRGVMLYTQRHVIDRVGGMDERFGAGGHEHVEWSQRICNAKLTSQPFTSPPSYGDRTDRGDATGASRLWHCTDMREADESGYDWGLRKAKNTTINWDADYHEQATALKRETKDSIAYVPYSARANGRPSATIVSGN